VKQAAGLYSGRRRCLLGRHDYADDDWDEEVGRAEASKTGSFSTIIEGYEILWITGFRLKVERASD
jgi:hypothetical protein